MLPSFHDSHVHPVTSGMELLTCDLNEAKTADDVFATIRRYAASHPDVPWIRGGGWQLPIFGSAGPTRAQLDALAADRPALLSSADGHSSWANSRALAIAGVTKETPDPPNGRIERDANGEPTGTLREDATELVTRFAPSRRMPITWRDCGWRCRKRTASASRRSTRRTAAKRRSPPTRSSTTVAS
ncbi:MAG: amidohydrolase family protein [Blastocatellia bacterium]|nr:amidohydrolase family protein [Blastocatellia bacterium]